MIDIKKAQQAITMTDKTMKKINDILNNDIFLSQLHKIDKLEEHRIFCKHNFEHLISVARIMLIKSYENNLQIEKEIIYATAILHDIGRAEQYIHGVNHEIAGMEIAKKILNAVDYEKSETGMIITAIGVHNNSVTTDTLGALLKYADKKSRNCFLCPASVKCKWSIEKKNKEIEL